VEFWSKRRSTSCISRRVGPSATPTSIHVRILGGSEHLVLGATDYHAVQLRAQLVEGRSRRP
jgi:hypothetical protein